MNKRNCFAAIPATTAKSRIHHPTRVSTRSSTPSPEKGSHPMQPHRIPCDHTPQAQHPQQSPRHALEWQSRFGRSLVNVEAKGTTVGWSSTWHLSDHRGCAVQQKCSLGAFLSLLDRVLQADKANTGRIRPGFTLAPSMLNTGSCTCRPLKEYNWNVPPQDFKCPSRVGVCCISESLVWR